VDRATIAVYAQHASTYLQRRGAHDPERAAAFAAAVPPGGRRLDLGSGPGHYLELLGPGPTVALDAAPTMLLEARTRHETVVVQADLALLPFRRGAFAGIWANKSLQHVPATDLPMALADCHQTLEVGGHLHLFLFTGEGTWLSDDDLPGRRFTLWEPDMLTDLVTGAGFSVEQVVTTTPEPPGPDAVASTWQAGTIAISATRARSLPDLVGPGMRLLISGLNPSIFSADAGIGFARPGNRFWPAMLAAGLATVERDGRDLLRRHGIGMTDLVKRPTVGAKELTTAEYRAGLTRIERLCALLAPAAVCFVGLAGWRAAVDRKAAVGWQPAKLGTTPVYVMENTSGLNARTPLASFVEHLRAAAAGTR
jgi:TDG/mug DNA glycosylase family protein